MQKTEEHKLSFSFFFFRLEFSSNKYNTEFLICFFFNTNACFFLRDSNWIFLEPLNRKQIYFGTRKFFVKTP